MVQRKVQVINATQNWFNGLILLLLRFYGDSSFLTFSYRNPTNASLLGLRITFLLLPVAATYGFKFLKGEATNIIFTINVPYQHMFPINISCPSSWQILEK